MGRPLSTYWWCQLAGWGVFTLIMSFAYFFVPKLTDFPNYFVVATTCLIGLFTSHLMRRFIVKTGVLNLTIRKQFVAIFFITISYSIIFLVL